MSAPYDTVMSRAGKDALGEEYKCIVILAYRKKISRFHEPAAMAFVVQPAGWLFAGHMPGWNSLKRRMECFVPEPYAAEQKRLFMDGANLQMVIWWDFHGSDGDISQSLWWAPFLSPVIRGVMLCHFPRCWSACTGVCPFHSSFFRLNPERLLALHCRTHHQPSYKQGNTWSNTALFTAIFLCSKVYCLHREEAIQSGTARLCLSQASESYGQVSGPGA